MSEIFLGLGAEKDYKSQWLELYNTSAKSLIINKLKIAIETETEREREKSLRVIETAINPPISFDERLIIANQKNLALDTCFNSPITQIAL